MKVLLACAITALASAGSTLKFTDPASNPTTCTIQKVGDSSNNAGLQASCGLSVSGDAYVTGAIGVPGHSNLLNYIDTIENRVTALETRMDDAEEAQSNFADQFSELDQAAANGGVSPPSGMPTGPVGAKWKLVAKIHTPTLAMWQGSNAQVAAGSKGEGQDYWIGMPGWRSLIDTHMATGTNAHLFVKIFMDTSDYVLQYNDFRINSSQQYSHQGGVCYGGGSNAQACPSGPQMQHNDGRSGYHGSWYDGACCCSNNNGFGWYGSCGFGQFGFIADGSHGGKFSHPIAPNGNYVNPPVGSDARGMGNVLYKEFWMRLD